MAAQGNLTIKKNDGTTDIVWSAISPSAGAGVPAVWKSLTVGSADDHHPEFRLSSAISKDGKSTKMRGTLMYPSLSTDTTTGLTTVVRNSKGFIDWDMPRGMPDAEINEFVQQFANLIVHGDVRYAIKTRVSPT